LGHAAVAAGLARAAVTASIRYVKERTVVGPMTLANFDGVQTTIAEMAAEAEAAELLVYRAAFPVPGGPDPVLFMMSTMGNDLALRATDRAVRVHGGAGITREFPVERYFRDARSLPFISAVWDFHRLLVGRQLLDVPMGGPPPGEGGPRGAGGPGGPGYGPGRPGVGPAKDQERGRPER
jgi:alkylation response protein AidB-like acyl-CoA dehydrogenase